MKTQTFETSKDLFKAFLLVNEEMINVRGGNDGETGEGEPVVHPTPPPVII